MFLVVRVHCGCKTSSSVLDAEKGLMPALCAARRIPICYSSFSYKVMLQGPNAFINLSTVIEDERVALLAFSMHFLMYIF